MSNSITSKRFVIRKSLIGQNTTINVTFKHDKAFELMKDNLTKLACWDKYKSYTSSTSIPRVLQGDAEVV